jgi:DNA polymerase I-like protein with 3'-5' exonuclease and polymerase domains
MIYLVSGQQSLFESDLYKHISIEESFNIIKDWTMSQLDTETSGRDAHVNDLLCVQIGNVEGTIQIVIDTSTIDIKKYKDFLENTYCIGHNLKFDLQFLYNYDIIPRKVYDTMIVEQLLYLGYPSGIISYSLKGVAERRLNIDIDKSTRGEIIWRGLDEKVIQYAAGDVQYLGEIMKLQIKDCKEKQCLVGAKLECDFVPAIAYLEWCGIKLDEHKWKEKMFNDLQNLNTAEDELNKFAVKDPKLESFTYIERQGSLFDGFDLTPKVNINWSSSQQVIKVAKALGFDTTVQDKKTGEDKDSVLEKHLKSQKGINDEFLDLYFAYQGYAKVVSSFGQSQLNMINPNTGRCHTVYKQLGAASGRMSCGSQNSNTDLAKLKKISPKECTYCNFQQLPADHITRSCFVAEKGNLFCSCDFSALESRLGADIYQEHSMIEEFLYKSGDIHSLVAKACFPELKDKTTEEIKKDFPHLRKKAKPIGFSQQFGGSARAIAQSLGCPLEEAETIAKAYLDGFPGIAKFKAEGSKAVRQNGYVLMCKYTGHKMYWWDHNKWLERQKSFTSEFWDEYRIKHKGTSDAIAMEVREHFQAASKWDRMALNAPTQNTGVVILKDAITGFFNYIVDNNLFNVVKIVALVHDEANIEYPKELNMDKILKEHMEKSAAKYCKSLPIPAEASVNLYWVH